MPADVQISFRGMESSPSAEAQVRRRADELQRIPDRVAECRVMLEAAHRHHRQGKIYHVRVELGLPGGEVVVNREPGADHAHEDLHVAIRDAFKAARRRLQDHMRRLTARRSSTRHQPSAASFACSPSAIMTSWKPTVAMRFMSIVTPLLVAASTN